MLLFMIETFKVLTILLVNLLIVLGIIIVVAICEIVYSKCKRNRNERVLSDNVKSIKPTPGTPRPKK